MPKKKQTRDDAQHHFGKEPDRLPCADKATMKALGLRHYQPNRGTC